MWRRIGRFYLNDPRHQRLHPLWLPLFQAIRFGPLDFQVGLLHQMCSVCAFIMHTTFDLLKRKMIWWYRERRPGPFFCLLKPGLSRAWLQAVPVVIFIDFHIQFWPFVVHIERLDHLVWVLQVSLIHLDFAHHLLHFVVLVPTVLVHFREVGFASLLKLFGCLNVTFALDRNAFGVEKASDGIFLDCTMEFLILLEIFDFQSYLIGRFWSVCLFRKSRKCSVVHVKSSFSRAVLRFAAWSRNFAPHWWLNLRLQELFVISE